ncbi:MAG: sensor histidine kinase [Cyclobacteriaceae bacterium]
MSGEFLSKEGKKFYKDADYDKAVLIYGAALSLFIQEGDSIGIANILNRRGLAYFRKGDNTFAIDDYLHSAAINEAIKNEKGLANNYFNLGNLYAEGDTFDKAFRYLKSALKYYKNQGNEGMYFGVANTLGTIFYEKLFDGYDLDSSQYYLDIAYDGFSRLGATHHLIGIKQNFGVVQEQREDYKEALVLYEQAKEGFDSLNDDYRKARVMLNIGIVHEKLNHSDFALQVFEEGIAIAEDLDIENLILDFLEHIIRNDLNKRYSEKTNKYFERYATLREKIFDAEIQEKIAEKEAYYQNEKKQREIENKEAMITQQTKEKNLILTALAVVLILTVLIIVFYTQRQRVVRQLAEKRTKLHHQEVNKMLQDHELERMNAMIGGQEKERNRIATDLHDRLGSTLSAVKLHLNAYESLQTAGQYNEVEEQRDRLGELLDRAVKEVREISHDMLSGVLTKFGLAAALEDLKETLESSRQYRVHMQIINMQNRVDNTLELHLYRIVQELVSNILKHAHASNITVQLNKLEDEIILMVEDDGIGFSTGTGSGDGVGLHNVADRVKSLGGALHVDTQPGRGATITVEIPTT